jgi:hypothetical protein
MLFDRSKFSPKFSFFHFFRGRQKIRGAAQRRTAARGRSAATEGEGGGWDGDDVAAESPMLIRSPLLAS